MDWGAWQATVHAGHKVTWLTRARNSTPWVLAGNTADPAYPQKTCSF